MWGGKRTGSGRPVEGIERKRYTFSLTAGELIKVKDFVETLRKETSIMEKASVVTDFKKSMLWGLAPFPAETIPVAVSENIDTKGILLYYPKTQKFVLGLAGAIKSIDERTAKKIMAAVTVK